MILAWLLLGGLADAPAPDPLYAAMGRLPAPGRPAWRPADRLPDARVLGEGISAGLGTPAWVGLEGIFARSRGPEDHGLEILASLAGGRGHESLFMLRAGRGGPVKMAVLAAFGWQDGLPAEDGLPARGIPVRVLVACEQDDGRRWLDASCLVRDRATDRPFPPLPYVWTGSRFVTAAVSDGERMVERTVFAPDLSLVAISNEDSGGALLASVLPSSPAQLGYETHSALAPPADTPVVLYVLAARLTCRLRLMADGALTLDSHRVDNASLARVLADAFAAPAADALRAVAVEVGPSVPRSADRAAALTIVTAASSGGVWCLPVFVPLPREANHAP